MFTLPRRASPVQIDVYQSLGACLFLLNKSLTLPRIELEHGNELLPVPLNDYEWHRLHRLPSSWPRHGRLCSSDRWKTANELQKFGAQRS